MQKVAQASQQPAPSRPKNSKLIINKTRKHDDLKPIGIPQLYYKAPDSGAQVPIVDEGASRLRTGSNLDKIVNNVN